MMHVAYLIPTIDRIGGAERQVILLATGMAQRGWRVSIIALSGSGGNALEELATQGISYLSLEMRKGLVDPRGWIKLHRWLASHKPDLVHAHLPHAALLARWSRLGTPLRVLVDAIHSPATGGLFRRAGYRMSSRLTNLVISVSASAAAPWLRAGMVRHSDLAIIPNGIDVGYWKRDDRIREKARRRSEFTDEFVWLAVGRLDPVKDHATLLRAFVGLPARAHLVLAGTGPLEPMLRRLARELNIASRVTFLGFEDDVLTWMQQADGFVLNSRWEGLPIALLEACACELPAVITNTSGAREVLPGSPVKPVPVGDPDALATAMNAVMSLPDAERRAVGICERGRVMESFNLGGILNRYEALYGRALAANPHPSRWKSSLSHQAMLIESKGSLHTLGPFIAKALAQRDDAKE